MKVMKLALLGTAALAAVSVSARADNLSDLKAQIETLNARVATLEATPAVPAGYSMVAFSKGSAIVVPGVYDRFHDNADNGTAHVISVIPSADAPAAASAVITWSGWVRGAITTSRDNTRFVTATGFLGGFTTNATTVVTSNLSQYSTDIRARAEIVVSGKTDTAIGEVGARMALESGAGSAYHDASGTDSPFTANAQNNGAVTTDGFWGWWKMTPALTLGAGVDGSVAKSGQGFDARCTCYYEPTNGGIINNPNGDPAQIRLSYADGPIGFAVALEDSNNGFTNNNSAVGVAAKVAYSGDMWSADLNGGYWGNAIGTAGQQAAWGVSAGVGVNLGSMALLSAAVGTGAGFATGSSYTKASALLRFNMTDVAHLELGIGHSWNQNSVLDATVFGGGIYYDPVKQLTIGAEGAVQTAGVGDGNYFADLVTVFRF